MCRRAKLRLSTNILLDLVNFSEFEVMFGGASQSCVGRPVCSVTTLSAGHIISMCHMIFLLPEIHRCDGEIVEMG